MRVEKWLKIGKTGWVREKDLALETLYIEKNGTHILGWGGANNLQLLIYSKNFS